MRAVITFRALATLRSVSPVLTLAAILTVATLFVTVVAVIAFGAITPIATLISVVALVPVAAIIAIAARLVALAVTAVPAMIAVLALTLLAIAAMLLPAFALGIVRARFAVRRERGRACAMQMVLAGAIGVLLVHWLKRRTARSRPYECMQGVRLRARALDRFSFPSGHTVHAVTFTAVLAHYYPSLALVLLPFIVVLGFSRVILGLHYPSDVLAGVAIGIVLASITPLLV